MRLDALLDSFYVLGSLWGGPTCPVSPAAGPFAPRGLAAVTAFLNVNVVPMDTERVLADQTVLVEDGRITVLGSAGEVKVPVGAVRIDGRNKYLMPGLTDMHFGPGHRMALPRAGKEQTFADELFIRYVAHGVTAVRSLTGSSSSQVQQLQRFAAQYPIPRMYLASRGIPQSRPDSVASYIAGLKSAGYNHIDADPNITRSGHNPMIDSLTMLALVKGGFPPTTHAHNAPFPQVLQLGVGGGSVEHLYVFLQTLLGISDSGWNPLANRPAVELPMAKVPAVVTALKGAGVWITPSLRCMEIVHPYIKGDGLARSVKALQDAGVKMLLGGDAGALQETSVHGELVAMVRAGLTPYQALQAATRNVAEYFHLLDSAGTVAVGKRADLVLLNDNPLRDVRYTWEPAGVMLAGRWFDRTALDQRQLTAPRVWFTELLGGYALSFLGYGLLLPRDIDTASFAAAYPSASRSSEQWDELERRGKRVFALADSLDSTNRQAYERVLGLITAELGPIRVILVPEQRRGFDILLRVWMREQARQGYVVAVPGVSPTP